MIAKNLFTGGLNSDDSPELIPNTDYKYALNCTISMTDNGSNFSVSNTQGTTLVSYTLPAGTNKVIGAEPDLLTQSTLYFVQNSTSRDSILQYQWASNSVVKILEDDPGDPVLNFNSDYKITGINLVNGELLYWTDNNVEPKKINITKAKANEYPSPFSENFIYAIKQPPLFPPTVGYANDLTKNINYLTGFLFQFKYRYIYDDYEKSAFSPISAVPLPALTFSKFTDEFLNNAIDITYNTGSGIVTKIELAGRIGNTGDFFSIATIDKSDKFNPLASDATVVYRFLNDKSYLNIDIKESNKLFDNLPKKAKSQEVIDPTRIAYGDVLDGFDPVEVVAKLDVTVNAQPNVATYSIKGKIFIKNPFAQDPYYQFCQPIYRTTSDATYKFGGVSAKDQSTGASNTTLNFVDPVSQGQALPAGGFTVYLAGTDYVGVSVQQQVINIFDSGMFQDSVTGLYVLNDVGKTYHQYVASQGMAYSNFTISGVPPGKYVMRFAGNDVTQADINDGTRDYQKTSTSTVSVGDSGLPEYIVEITNADVTIPDSAIFDLSFPLLDTQINNPFAVKANIGFNGYLTDSDTTLVQTRAGLLADTRIELANVNFVINGGSPSSVNVSGFDTNTGADKLQEWLAGYSATDHNGYWFVSFPVLPFGTRNINATDITSGTTNLTATSGDLLRFDGTGGTYTVNSTIGSSVDVILRTSVNTLLENERTHIVGTITNISGSVISGIIVIISKGKFSKSSDSGAFSILVYSDTKILSQRIGDIYYVGPPTSSGTFIPTSDYFDIGLLAGGGSVQQIQSASPYSGTYNYNFNCQTTTVIASLIGLSSSESSEKRAGVYQYGIVYYDHANRSGLTNTNNMSAITTNTAGSDNGLKVYIPYYTEINPGTGLVYGGGTIRIDWSIYNEPPSWATHYQWVRTKNMANNRFIQFAAKDVVYTDDYDNPTTKALATKVKIDVTNINTDYKKVNPTSQLYYDWIKKPVGDRIRFIKDSGGNFFNAYIDTAVIDYNNNFVILDNIDALPDLTGQNGFLYEIYNPKLQLGAEEQLFWEIDECYEVGFDAVADRYYHKGPLQDQDPTTFTTNTAGQVVSSVPAEGAFKTGDTYYRIRNMPVGVGGTKQYFIEDGSVSDFYASAVIDIGRPNRYDPDYRETRRISTIPYSGLYIPETNINNLNSFYDTDFETYEQKYGSIQKLYNQDHNLVVFQELKVGQIPVNLNVIYDNAGNGNLASSVKVLNNIVYYAGEFGIGLNPESFAVYGNSKYFTDRNRFAVLRLDRNGIVAISDYKMHGEFISFFNDVRVNSNQYFYGTYDLNKKKYILSREAYASIPGKTVAFSEATNRWESYYSYLPEFMSASEASLISFKDGALWNHNSNTYNNFYGVQYNSEMWCTFNANPSKVKAFMALSEETSDVWTAEFTTPNGQASNLIEDDFEEKENMQYAGLLFDTNTPNVSDPLNEGDTLRDTTLLAKLSNSLTTYTRLFAVNIVYENSERSNK